MKCKCAIMSGFNLKSMWKSQKNNKNIEQNGTLSKSLVAKLSITSELQLARRKKSGELSFRKNVINDDNIPFWKIKKNVTGTLSKMHVIAHRRAWRPLIQKVGNRGIISQCSLKICNISKTWSYYAKIDHESLNTIWLIGHCYFNMLRIPLRIGTIRW